MSDNDIIKALECCNGYSCCEECPFYKGKGACDVNLYEQALDLINRQKAKIEVLEMDNAQLQSDIVNANMNSDHALAEIERLEARNVNNCRNWQTKYNSLRAEAIKEFVEMLKKEMAYCSAETDEMIIFETEFDNFVQEMTEGKE